MVSADIGRWNLTLGNGRHNTPLLPAVLIMLTGSTILQVYNSTEVHPGYPTYYSESVVGASFVCGTEALRAGPIEFPVVRIHGDNASRIVASGRTLVLLM